MKFFVGTMVFLAVLAVSNVSLGIAQDPTTENQPNPTNPAKPITPIPPNPPASDTIDNSGAADTGGGAGRMANPEASPNPVPSP